MSNYYADKNKEAYRKDSTVSQASQNGMVSFIKNTLRRGMDFAEKIIAYAT